MATQESTDPSTKGIVGIQNMGNTCYCNTTLQLLRACPEWTAFCLTQPFKELWTPQEIANDPNKRVLLAYQDMLQALWSSYAPAYVRPVGFLHEIRLAVAGTPYEMFGLPIPNDSHEYLVYLLDHFHEALKRPTISWQPEQAVDPHTEHPIQRMQRLARNGWNTYFASNASEVVQTFFGMMRKTVQCTGCQNETYQWEVFNSIKVPCTGSTFAEWIRAEVNETSEIDAYQCDHCNGRHRAILQSHIWKMPSNLFLMMRRFHFDGQKVMTPCVYDGQPLSFLPYYAPESDDPLRATLYELHGVSDHHGTHMGGHYTAQFKHPITGEWWWFDDQVAHRMGAPQCSTASNYLFYFRKR